jgi:cbb3-type cytochrome oxidase subunit 3
VPQQKGILLAFLMYFSKFFLGILGVTFWYYFTLKKHQINENQ